MTGSRATSTVLDAALFLLLVGAAVATLTVPTGSLPSADADAADEMADVLATSTADVRYSLAPGARCATSAVLAFPRTSGPQFERTAHGTLAGHLASAALGNLTVDGVQVTHTRDDYERAVANATRNATRRRVHLTHVRAVWKPYDDAPLSGEVSVGPTPPASAAVHAATLTVASGLPATRSEARAAANTSGNMSAVGDVVAKNVVTGLFPPDATRAALLGDYPVAQLVTYRYERVGRLVGTNVTTRARANDATGANERLADSLGRKLTADMRSRFESADAAAANVSVDTVRLTVRTWSP
ncbi:hypothetical protein ACFR9U_08095 [Halorientalis brevis]|uniref:Uncharacterized protein n=1 Tax=Halorientalis brevis TaxID=1126241 RepID=A0ABD6CA66_9EURY|nr:hypothetical protein [Halorientalis brevis]